MPTEVRPDQISGVPSAMNIPALIRADNTEVTVSNTLTETTIWTWTLPGGTLGASDGLLLELWGSFLVNVAGSITIRLKYGGTNVVAAVPTTAFTAQGATPSGIYVSAFLKNNGATNAQKGVLKAEFQPETLGGAGTAAIDSTVNQTLAVSVQWSVASASLSYVHYFVSVSYLPNT